jgi:excisionase family DNA binding protein
VTGVHSQADAVTATLALTLPSEVIDLIAARAAELVCAQVAPTAEPWIGVDEAAAHLACPKSRLYRLTSQAKGGRRSNPLPFERDGARLLFRRSDLDAWVARGGADR